MEVKSVVAENNTVMEGTKNKNNNKKLVVVVAECGDGGDDGKSIGTATTETQKKKKKKNRIQVSNSKMPLFFYLNLAKRYIREYNDVELSALGMAIPTVITISEILKRNGLAFEKNISISSVGLKDDKKNSVVLKAQLEIVLGKAEKLDKTTVATAAKKAADEKN